MGSLRWSSIAASGASRGWRRARTSGPSRSTRSATAPMATPSRPATTSTRASRRSPVRARRPPARASPQRAGWGCSPSARPATGSPPRPPAGPPSCPPPAGLISLVSPSSGTGDGTLSYVVAPNPGPGPRAGAILVGGLAIPVLQGGSFTDVPPSHPFHEFVGRLSARGVTQGCGGGLFCPDAPVTREQMAFFLLRALGEAVPPTPAADRFLDVPRANPFHAFIDRLAVLNITQGCGAVTFCPGASVSREQMAVFIIRALGEGDPPPPPVPTFLDVSPSSPFYPFIE